MSSSPSLTRWSSHAPRKTSRRIQCTRLRLAGPDQLGPVLVDVLAERGAGLGDLAVDGELEQVLQLVACEPDLDEVELHRRLLDALSEVLLVEGEPQLAVLEHVVGARVVVPSASCLLHVIHIGPDLTQVRGRPDDPNLLRCGLPLVDFAPRLNAGLHRARPRRPRAVGGAGRARGVGRGREGRNGQAGRVVCEGFRVPRSAGGGCRWRPRRRARLLGLSHLDRRAGRRGPPASPAAAASTPSG